MGVFDFVNNAGAKIGIGKSTDAELYVVKSGDTLWAIAREADGDGYPEVFETNKPMLTDPDLIFPGQVLRIPQ